MRWRILLASSLLVIAVITGWYWWSTRRIEWYGGVKPFMARLQALHNQTAAELARSQTLEGDYEEMEQLCQNAQDLIAVFTRWDDPQRNDPRFGPLALELQRQATQLENNWDHGTRDQALASFRALTAACNDCHTQIAPTVPPVTSHIGHD